MPPENNKPAKSCFRDATAAHDAETVRLGAAPLTPAKANTVMAQMHDRIRTLEAQLAEARKYAAPENASALSWVKNPCTRHNQYWTTASGACMACRAEKAEADRDVLAKEVRAWRHSDDTHPECGGPHPQHDRACEAAQRTDASGALSRAGGK